MPLPADAVILTLPDAAAWRAWLAEHHDTATGAWVLRARAGSGRNLVTYFDAIRQALCLALAADPTARMKWDAFPPSARKVALTAIAMARKPETRAARIARIVANAAAGIRP